MPTSVQIWTVRSVGHSVPSNWWSTLPAGSAWPPGPSLVAPVSGVVLSVSGVVLSVSGVVGSAAVEALDGAVLATVVAAGAADELALAAEAAPVPRTATASAAPPARAILRTVVRDMWNLQWLEYRGWFRGTIATVRRCP
jgi:hypothetical protein